MYQAVSGHVAVDPTQFDLPVSSGEMWQKLTDLGFVNRSLSIIDDLRSVAHTVRYKANAFTHEAPCFADCSSLMKWVFGRSGIFIPRRSIQQREAHKRILLDHVRAYDLVFTNGLRHNYYTDDPADGVGHVGIVTHQHSVIHLSRNGLEEVSLPNFFEHRKMRSACRVIQSPLSTRVVHIPHEYEIESSDCIKWLILRKLPRLMSSMQSA